MYKWPFCNILWQFIVALLLANATLQYQHRMKKRTCIVFKLASKSIQTKPLYLFSHSNHWLRYVQCWCWCWFRLSVTHSNTNKHREPQRKHTRNRSISNTDHHQTTKRHQHHSMTRDDEITKKPKDFVRKSKFNLIAQAHKQLSYIFSSYFFHATIIEMEEVPTDRTFRTEIRWFSLCFQVPCYAVLRCPLFSFYSDFLLYKTKRKTTKHKNHWCMHKQCTVISLKMDGDLVEWLLCRSLVLTLSHNDVSK